MCPVYEYECQRCRCIYDEYHNLADRYVDSLCPYCIGEGFEGRGIRLICRNPQVTKDRLYQFTDYNTTGKPVEIRDKAQWKKHLKSHGLHDDVSQSPMRREDLKPGMLNVNKKKMREELKDALHKSLQDKKHIRDVKENFLKRKGG